MVRAMITAALILTLGLSAAGCGAQNASTAAHRWNDAQVQNDLARGGPEDRTGSQDKTGVNGSNENAMTRAGEDVKNAGKDMAESAKDMGEDMMKGARDAGRSMGDAAEEILDGMTGTPKNSSY